MNRAIPLADWSLLFKLIDRSFTMRQVNLSCQCFIALINVFSKVMQCKTPDETSKTLIPPSIMHPSVPSININ